MRLNKYSLIVAAGVAAPLLVWLAASLGLAPVPERCDPGKRIETAAKAIDLAKHRALGDQYFWREKAGFPSVDEFRRHLDSNDKCCSASRGQEWGFRYWLAGIAVKGPKDHLEYSFRMTECGRITDQGWVSVK
jgi:hypothetical protein